MNNELIKKSIMKYLENDDRDGLVKYLDCFKGSFAVKYMLQAILDRKCGYTMTGVIQLLEGNL